jgi:hypothetical protein
MTPAQGRSGACCANTDKILPMSTGQEPEDRSQNRPRGHS